MESLNEISLKPIGWVRSPIKEPMREGWQDVLSEIILDADLEEALDGLEEFSHVIVFYWMHRVSQEGRSITKTHPQRREDLPLVGVFATRSPARANPIGMTAAKLVERKGNVLKVVGLDALDGTPVLDLKPYLPRDSLDDIRVPDWVDKLTERR